METHDAKDIERNLCQSLAAAIQSSIEVESQIEAMLIDKVISSSDKHDEGLRRHQDFTRTLLQRTLVEVERDALSQGKTQSNCKCSTSLKSG